MQVEGNSEMISEEKAFSVVGCLTLSFTSFQQLPELLVQKHEQEFATVNTKCKAFLDAHSVRGETRISDQKGLNHLPIACQACRFEAERETARLDYD